MSDNAAPSVSVPVTESLPQGHVLLSQAREAAGLSLDALSMALKVPIKRLEQLEAGDYAALPDITFARALAMSLCRYLQIDAQQVLERMPSSHMPNLGAKGLAGGDAMYATEEGLALSPVSVFKRPPFLIAVALLLAAGLLYNLPNVSEETAVPLVEPAEQLTAQPLPPQALEPPVSPTPAPPAPAAIMPAVTANPSVVLQVLAQDESWLEVIRPDGTVLLARLLKSGESVELGSAPPYTLVLGRASAAQVFVRGQAIELGSHTRGGVARYEVK